MSSDITSVGDEYIPFLSSLPPLNLRQDLEEKLFENKCEDCECYVKHRIESDFDKSSDEEMLEMSCDEFPLRTKQTNKQTKNLRGRGGRKVNNKNTDNYN